MTAPAASQSIPALSWPDQSDESEVCEGAAARLCIEWPALLNAVVQERYVNDGKLLGPPPGPRKQLLPIMHACAKLMHHYWRDPLDVKHGLAGLEVKDMAACGMRDLPTIDCKTS